MTEALKCIKVGIDYDGVIVKKPSSWDLPRRASKVALPTIPGVIEGINFLRSQQDVDVIGVYTARTKWLRKWQTERDVNKRSIPIEKITYSTNSSKKKIAELLIDALAEEDPSGLTDEYIPRTDVRRVVLIDDSIDEVVGAARQLAQEHPEFRKLLPFSHLSHLTLNNQKNCKK